MKPLIVLAAALSLTGCVSTGAIVESDYLEATIPVEHDTVLNNIVAGFPICGIDYGQPSVIQYKDYTAIDIYTLTLIRTRTNRILGKIELIPEDGQTKVRAGIRKAIARGQRRQNWIKWAQGDYQCKW